MSTLQPTTLTFFYALCSRTKIIFSAGHVDKDHVVIPLLKLIMKTYQNDLSDLCGEIKAKALSWNHKENCFLVWGSKESAAALSSKVTELCSMLEDLVRPSESSTCSACLCPVEEELVELTMCGHLYCTSCLDLHVDIAIRDRNLPVICVAHKCEELLLMNDVIDACARARGGTRHLLDASVRLYIAQQGKESPIAHCRTPDCPAVYFVSNKAAITGDKTTYFLCKASMCNKCHVTLFHDDYTCAVWKKRDNVDRKTASWFSEDVKDRTGRSVPHAQWVLKGFPVVLTCSVGTVGAVSVSTVAGRSPAVTPATPTSTAVTMCGDRTRTPISTVQREHHF